MEKNMKEKQPNKIICQEEVALVSKYKIPRAFTEAFPNDFMNVHIPKTTEAELLIAEINKKLIRDFISRQLRRLE